MSMISRQVAELREWSEHENLVEEDRMMVDLLFKAADTIEMLSEKARGQAWIPCEERLPEDLEIVNVTWVNHRPLNPCYEHLKDRPLTATAIHYGDRWWWFSPICKDLLAEYGKSVCDEVDEYIEITAWQPLPEPWKGADDE